MKKEIPFWEKSNLTIEEAAAYFNIGVHKLRKLACDEKSPYVLVDGYTDFVFLNRFGGLQHQGTLNKVYKRIIRDCNDAAFLENENPKVTQYLLGHSDFTTTMDLYTDVTLDTCSGMVEVLEKYVENMC